MFNGKRFVTSGIAEKVPLELQVTMWNMIDTMDEQKDYLQVSDKKILKKNGMYLKDRNFALYRTSNLKRHNR